MNSEAGAGAGNKSKQGRVLTGDTTGCGYGRGLAGEWVVETAAYMF